jgi:predicted XRE-type DNA-binding protein
MDSWVAACQDAVLCETMLLAALEALWGAQQLERKGPTECMQAAVEAMLAVLQSLPVFVGSLMESPLEHQQEQGTLSVAGWAATQMSLARNRRLRQALAHDDIAVDAPRMSEFATLLGQLPAHTYEAWYQEGWATVEELRTRIASLMEGYGIDPGLPAHLSPDSLQQFQQEIAQWGSSQGALEEWAAIQEASRRLDEIAARAGLSPREAEVLALQRQGLTQEQIGTLLHLPRNTVKTFVERGAEKMYRAARG